MCVYMYTTDIYLNLPQVSPKSGWTAPFLHRRDAQSGVALQLCEVRTWGRGVPGHVCVNEDVI